MGLRILGSVTATLMVAVTGILAAPGAANAVPAQATAACPTSSGVTAIVDFDELGGGVTAGCDSNGGGQAASQVFRDAGYTLEYSQQPGMNGFVCKIQSKPADGDCAANDAFWSLWWSDGRSGRWVFSSQGVGTIDVPDGGYVAFAWHEGSGRAEPPAVNPTPHIQPVEPSDEPSDNDGGNGGNNDDDDGNGGNNEDNDNNGGGSTTAVPTTTAAPSSTATTATSSTDSSSPGRPKTRDPKSTDPTSASSSTLPGAAEITDGPPPSDLATDTSDDDGGALTTWIGLGLAVVVLGAAGLVTVLRRRTG